MLGQAKMRFFLPRLKKRHFILSEIQSSTFYCLEQQNRNSHAKIQPKRVYLEFFINLKVGSRQESAYPSFIFLTVVWPISGTSLCSGVFNGYHRILQSFLYTVVYFYSFLVWKCSRAGEFVRYPSARWSPNIWRHKCNNWSQM